MVTKLKEVDVAIVGLGWTGGILGKELAEAGLKVVAIERGEMRTTADDFAVPNIRDELRYINRQDLMMNTARDTLTIRNAFSQDALPMRRLGSFLPGDGVGGSGVHWSGHTWRWTDMEFKVRSMYEERYGKSFIPDDMTIQDWPVSYDELEPFYDRFDKICGVSGQTGNLRGKKIEGGNTFEGPRSDAYPNAPIKSSNAGLMFGAAAKSLGYHPFPAPVAIASAPYVNAEGTTLGACEYCGYCNRIACETNAKASANSTSRTLAASPIRFSSDVNSVARAAREAARNTNNSIASRAC